MRPKPEVVDLRSEDRWGAIDELVDYLAARKKINPEHRELIAALVRDREKTMSTGIGLGVGLPHVSTDLVCEIILALGRSRSGIDFGALDGQPVRLVILLLMPSGQVEDRRKVTANLTKLMQRQDFRDDLWRRLG